MCAEEIICMRVPGGHRFTKLHTALALIQYINFLPLLVAKRHVGYDAGYCYHSRHNYGANSYNPQPGETLLNGTE